MKRKIFSILAICVIFTTAIAYADTAVYFSPNGGCRDAIIIEIDKAQNTIDIALYYFTSREIAQELVKAKYRNVKVRIVLDSSQEEEAYSKSRYLINRGVEVRYYAGSGLMHNKFAIIDGKVLITGSFNWTPTADRKNEENLLIMTDKELLKKYSDRFEYLWERSRNALP